MTEEDWDIAVWAFPEWAARLDGVRTIGLLSPYPKQAALIEHLFPRRVVTRLTIREWDLNHRHPEKYDLLVAFHVLAQSSRPAVWFENLFASCRVLWLQEIIDRWRGGPDRQLGHDGESTRFSYLPGFRSHFDGAFDIATAGEVRRFVSYPGGGDRSVHFIAEMVARAPEPAVTSG